MPVMHMYSTVSQAALLERLLSLIQRLYTETDGFLDRPEDPQLWYNRGYANGMIEVLTERGHTDVVLANLKPDAADVIGGHQALSWGKAYQHGREMGASETQEVLGPPQTQS